MPTALFWTAIMLLLVAGYLLLKRLMIASVGRRDQSDSAIDASGVSFDGGAGVSSCVSSDAGSACGDSGGGGDGGGGGGGD